MRSATVICVVLGFVIASNCGFAVGQTKPSGESTQDADAIWKAVVKAGTQQDDTGRDSPDPKVRGNWLALRAYRLNDAFFDAVNSPNMNSPNLRDKLRYYIDQFGKHGAEADLDWLLAAPNELLPHTAWNPNYHDIEREPGVRGDAMRGANYLTSLISELEIQRFAGDAKLLDRYYRAMMWSNCCWLIQDGNAAGFPSSVDYLRKAMADKQNSVFWITARLFVVMAYATNRDDLIASDEPTLRANYAKWQQWMDMANGHLIKSTSGPTWVYDPIFLGNAPGDPPMGPVDTPFAESRLGIGFNLGGLALEMQQSRYYPPALEKLGRGADARATTQTASQP